MKKYLKGVGCYFLILFFSSFSLKLNAQDEIKFETGLSWEQIKEKAKDEHKYIFVDCFATWCGPCKFMSRNIFTLKEVGDFYNANYINVKVQMDRTDTDSYEIRNWYQKASGIQSEFSINAFPTYLFFSPDGQIVHRVIGATGNEGTAFIEKGKEALDTTKQYYRVVREYKNHLDDSSFLLKTLNVAIQNSDAKNVSQILDAYLVSIKDKYLKENLHTIILATSIGSSSESLSFQFLNGNSEKIGKIIGDEDRVNALIRHIITIEQVYPLFSGSMNDADWEKLTSKIKLKYPGYADRIIMEAKPSYYASKNEYEKYGIATLAFLEKYGAQAGNFDINADTWSIFLHCKDKQTLKKAATWSKKTLCETCNPAYYDTYANLLYKVGEQDSALTWERKAVEVAERLKWMSHMDEFTSTIGKMQRGEKTLD